MQLRHWRCDVERDINFVKRNRLALQVGLQMAQISLEMANLARCPAQVRQGGIAAPNTQHDASLGYPVHGGDSSGRGSGLTGH